LVYQSIAMSEISLTTLDNPSYFDLYLQSSKYNPDTKYIFKPNAIVAYASRSNNKVHDNSRTAIFENSFRSNQVRNLSDKGKRTLKDCMNLMLITNEKRDVKINQKLFVKNFRLAFVTLTLPVKQFHTDNDIKKNCLAPFIDNLCKTHSVTQYIWRAEKQVNGNLHFHMIINAPIPFYMIRYQWNKQLNKLGYIDKFYLKHGHRNPPTEQIVAPKKIKNLQSYLTKYLTKTQGLNQVQGKNYGISQNLRSFKFPVCERFAPLWNTIQQLKQHFKPKIITGDFFKILVLSFHKYFKYLDDTLKTFFVNYFQSYKLTLHL